MKTHSLLILPCLVLGAAGLGAEKPAATEVVPPKPPERQELWVPTKDLEKVLKENPNAVMLSPEQYQALVREAGKMKPGTGGGAAGAKAPEEVIVEGLHLKGKVEPGARRVVLNGELTVQVPAEGWHQTSLPWPWSGQMLNATGDGALLAHVRVAESAPAQKPAAKSPPGTLQPKPTEEGSLELMARGPGRRTLSFQVVLPFSGQLNEDKRVRIPNVGCGGSLELELPAGSKLLPGFSASEQRGTVVKAAFDYQQGPGGEVQMDAGSVANDACRVAWIETGYVAGETGIRSGAGATARYEINENEIRGDLTFSLSTGGVTEQEQVWPVTGKGAEVVDVTGPDVLKWRQEGAGLHVTLRGTKALRQVAVRLRMPWSETTAGGVELPALKPPGALAATLDIKVSEGLDLLSVDGVAEKDARLLFRLGTDQPKVALRLAKPRLESDVDALVKLDKDSVNITRTLALRTDRAVNEVKVTLPAGEEFISVVCLEPAKESEFEWKRVDRTLELRFLKGLSVTAAAKVTVTTRKKLAKAWSGPRIPEAVTLENLALPEAVKVAGYTALEFDEAWRVSLKEVKGLEDRDARMTPVKGRMAWFGLREWSLALEVERAESVYSAEITAFALPRARTVEIEGQITLDISGAPLRSFQVKLPPETAKVLRVTSPLVGEQQLDEATGLWTFTLRQESKGRPNIRFRMSLAAVADSAASLQTRVTLPRLEMPQARRFQGTWVVEANTDTQLAFETQSMQPLDVLRAPAVEGYQPRHRLVSAYVYGVGAGELKITASRHEHSELALLVVNKLVMTSALSTDGTSRHEAVVNLRHSGEQFLPMQLPSGARLLSALVEHMAVKPVRSEEGVLAIPLPGESANRSNVRVVVLYELAGEAWSGAGRRELTPVTFPGNVPILATDWRVYAPEGYSYDKADTRLEQAGFHDVKGWMAVLTSSGSRPRGPVSGAVSWQSQAPMSAPADDRTELKAALLEGSRAIETGDYDRGIKTLEEVLRRDPYNTAARRGMELAERKRAEYFDSARDHQRARMLGLVDEAWENKPPVRGLITESRSQPGSYLIRKMEKIVFPQVQFSGASIDEAVEFLRVKSRDLDVSENDPSKRGVNIILKAGDSPSSSTISLDLKNVPMTEALRYVTELAGMKYKVEPFAVLIVPVSETSAEQYTRIYKMPPDFLNRWNGSRSPKETVLEILKNQGIPFPEGATAVFNQVTSQLIVKNTQPNLDLVETFLDAGHAIPVQPAEPAAKVGLLPLDLDLPTAGTVLRFYGAQAPESITLGYASWERQMMTASVWMVLGAAGFVFWGRRRAVLRTFAAALVLTAGVALVAPTWLTVANALLFGWLVALVCWVAWRLVQQGAAVVKTDANANVNVRTQEEVAV